MTTKTQRTKILEEPGMALCFIPEIDLDVILYR